MNKEEAFILLNANEENWEDRIDQIIFDYKKNVFQNSIVVKVYTGKLKKLKVLSEAENTLRKSTLISLESEFESPFKMVSTIAELLNLFRTYESEISEAKKGISMSASIGELAVGMNLLKNIEQAYIEKLFPLSQKLQVTNEEEVKISEWVNTGKIIMELINLPEKEKQITTKEIEATNYLQKELKRIIKCKLVH